ncbi:MAG TPA: hypothetical protein VGN37_00420 [Actinocatenispora sp.]
MCSGLVSPRGAVADGLDIRLRSESDEPRALWFSAAVGFAAFVAFLIGLGKPLRGGPAES